MKPFFKMLRCRFVMVITSCLLTLFTLSAVKDLTHVGFQKVDSSLWKKLVKHVQREFEGKYWVDDRLQEEHIEEFIIRLGGDGDDESSSETSGNESSSDEAFSD